MAQNMNLALFLDNAKKTNIKKIEIGSAKTIEDFWDSFIYPMLPKTKEDIDKVLELHRMLVRYVNDSEAVFVVRAFGSWDPKSVEVKQDDELRRGFLTIPSNATYQYVFDDNFYAAYFARMAYERYCPSYDEFKEAMLSYAFPARFGRSCKLERDKAVFNIKGPDPGITRAGYKIAHIFNAGAHFSIDNHNDINLNELSKIYAFPRGKYSDWKEEMVNGKQIYVRHEDIVPETLEVFKAHFLRFVDPLNYFLSPKAKQNKFFNNIKQEIGYDIAEYKPLLDYVSNKFKGIYGEEYNEYLTKILLPENYVENSNGDEIIDIEYGKSFDNSKTKKAITCGDEMLKKILSAYLIDGKAYTKIEAEILGLDSKTTKGYQAMSILRSVGVLDKSYKGILKRMSLSELESIANRELKKVLNMLRY